MLSRSLFQITCAAHFDIEQELVKEGKAAVKKQFLLNNKSD